MILYTVYKDAMFNDDEEIKEMEKKHNLKIVDMTKYEVQFCKQQNGIYHGPTTYLFIGDWKNLVNYFTYDYRLEDIEELVDLVKSIKVLDF